MPSKGVDKYFFLSEKSERCPGKRRRYISIRKAETKKKKKSCMYARMYVYMDRGLDGWVDGCRYVLCSLLPREAGFQKKYKKKARVHTFGTLPTTWKPQASPVQSVNDDDLGAGLFRYLVLGDVP